MIQMDESELSYSDFSDDALRLVEELFGPEAREKLLIPRDLHAKVPDR